MCNLGFATSEITGVRVELVRGGDGCIGRNVPFGVRHINLIIHAIMQESYSLYPLFACIQQYSLKGISQNKILLQEYHTTCMYFCLCHCV